MLLLGLGLRTELHAQHLLGGFDIGLDIVPGLTAFGELRKRIFAKKTAGFFKIRYKIRVRVFQKLEFLGPKASERAAKPYELGRNAYRIGRKG